ncbi:MAG: AmpG family muropeptide MFS transporter [Rhodospirillaceae bacterium]|jgi:MFS transporter, PAT family, beta-lactamase induction signal transducer AmpG|nr:AmpG family muropeptide MFS transporter [Rhodospirillaceae bacterium]MBT4487180.1 AmpG family muropeptide MFS transporter [Rhodospirillaceae bacterium]MBT5195065.1 AmpG family muropeptide MFS transporter [Rhodospirillaceae bacterium]MBT5895736.1 AmpG family muropeptide MFS transporter [Rhodospirillaceae bacterium]MBT6426893.1 AmpG family muropeptide MFS transporter [Rhodospirillaceae bacterium]
MSETKQGAPQGWLAAVRVYSDRRVIAILFLGFSSGMPLLLTFSTLSIWLAEDGISKSTIGLFALVGMPYSLKFIWAPLIDRLHLPLLTRWLGRRRGWAVLTQLALMVGIVGLGTNDPAQGAWSMAAWAMFVTFASASQDVVIDAYRVEILEERQYGAGAAMIVAGYRIGMLASGAGALFLAEAFSWFWVYCAMAALMGVGLLTILLNPEPGTGNPDEENAPGRADPVQWLREAVYEPFADFLRRGGWLPVLLFVVLYKFGDSLAGIMAGPFYVEIGFSKSEIASVSKIFGLGATLLGGFLGGLLVVRRGIMASLLWCGLLQMFSNLMFAIQAMVGHDISMLAATIAVENIAGGMGTAAFVAYLSSLCNIAYTATQYALLSSLMAVARTMLSAPGGALADATSWVSFFLITTIAALPGLVLLWWLMRRGIVPTSELARDGP